MPQSDEEKKGNAEAERVIACLERGVSPCCEAPLDLSHVIKSGRYKGHGKRFCSQCRRWVGTV